MTITPPDRGDRALSLDRPRCGHHSARLSREHPGAGRKRQHFFGLKARAPGQHRLRYRHSRPRLHSGEAGGHRQGRQSPDPHRPGRRAAPSPWGRAPLQTSRQTATMPKPWPGRWKRASPTGRALAASARTPPVPGRRSSPSSIGLPAETGPGFSHKNTHPEPSGWVFFCDAGERGGDGGRVQWSAFLSLFPGGINAFFAKRGLCTADLRCFHRIFRLFQEKSPVFGRRWSFFREKGIKIPAPGQWPGAGCVRRGAS